MDTEESLRAFLEKIGKLEPIEYKTHPADRVLIDYLSSKLSEGWRFSDEHLEKLLKGELEAWTHTDVSAHVLTCSRCARRVTHLKSPVFRIFRQARESMKELAQRMKRPALRPLLQRRAVFYGHLAAYALASLFIFLSVYQLPPFRAAGPPEAHEGIGLQPRQEETKRELPRGVEMLAEKEMPTAYAVQPRRPSFHWVLWPLWGALVILHGVIALKKRHA